jgi:hypothetical protein
MNRRLSKLEKDIGSEKKMSWLEFIQGDTWPGGPPEGLENVPDEAPRPLTEYERTYHVRADEGAK